MLAGFNTGQLVALSGYWKFPEPGKPVSEGGRWWMESSNDQEFYVCWRSP